MARRVLFVNHVGRVSGAEQSLLTLLASLDRERFVARLAAPPGDLLERAAGLGVEVVPIAFGRLHRRGGVAAWLGSGGRLMRAAAGLVPLLGAADLVHANSSPAALAASLAPALGRPLVWHVRDLILPPGVVPVLRRTSRRAIAISRVVASRLIRGGMPAGRISVVPNALDPRLFAPSRSADEVRAEVGLAADDEVVVAVGQLVPWKGHDVLLDAVARLAPGRPRLRLLVVGDDLYGEHPGWVATLRARAAAAPLAGRVVWTGYRRDVADLLGAADVLALPSRGEPFGRVLLEAMAVGLPQVATRSGGTQEVLVPGRTGLLVPEGDAAALARALAAVLDLGPAGRRRLGEAGRRRAATRFAPQAHAAEVEALFERVLEEQR